MGKRSGKVRLRAGVAASTAGWDHGAAIRARRATASPGPRRAALAVLLACGLGMVSPVYAQAVIFQETFTGGRLTSNGNPVTPTSNPPVINNFTGASNMTYTAGPAWTTSCNGFVSSWSMTDNNATGIASCGNQAIWNQVQGLVLALGAYGANLPSGQNATNAGAAATANLA